MIRHSRLSFISDVQAHSIVIGMDGNKQHCLFYFWLICKIKWRKFIWENLKKKNPVILAQGGGRHLLTKYMWHLSTIAMGWKMTTATDGIAYLYPNEFLTFGIIV